MNTQDILAPDGQWLDRANLRRVGFWTLVFLGITWALAPWLDRPDVQPIRNYWVLAGHPLGNHPNPLSGYGNVASYPMWGYSLLMRLFGSVTAVVVLQSSLCALATAALLVRLNCLAPRAKVVTTTLFLVALPWLSYMTYAYQVPISAAFMILTLLALEMALLTGSFKWGIVAGVLAGIGPNFRSELLLLPGTILVSVLVLRRLKWFRCPSLKPLGVSVVAALMLQLPWALNCYFNAGRFSLTESALGQVAYSGLGKLRSNPWNIVSWDLATAETVTKAGLDCCWTSFEAGDFFKQRFLANVKRHPLAYAKTLAARARTTVIQPFNYILLAATPAEDAQARGLAGWGSRASAWGPASEHGEQIGAVSKVKVASVLIYSGLQQLLMRAISILGIVGFFLALRSGPFRLNQPLVLCLAIAVLYRFGLNIALYDNGKYMTSVYLCYLPFAVNSLWQISQTRLWRRATGRRGSKTIGPEGCNPSLKRIRVALAL